MIRFEALPRPVRQLGVALVGARNRVVRYGPEYRRWRKFLVDSDQWSATEVESWQKLRLRRLVDSATAGTPYYKEIGLSSMLPREPSASLKEMLSSLPVLSKRLLKTRPADFRNQGFREVMVTSTSGSTGTPMSVGHEPLSMQRRFAMVHDHLARAGVDPFSRSVRLSGRLICTPGEEQKSPWLLNAAEQQLFLSSYHLDKVHARRVAGRLSSFRPVLMDGYPTAILSTLRLTSGMLSEPLPLRAIVTTAETLHPDVRQELERLSGALVLDYYAASEGVPFIQQCVNGTYHVRWQSGVFEVDSDGRIGLEGDGELICTSFDQDRTPLIRYRTGDLVEGLRARMEDVCACGIDSPTVSRVIGRVEDLVYTEDGRALGMFTYRTLKLVPGLGEAKVVQEGVSDFLVTMTHPEGRTVEAVAADIKAVFERVLGNRISLRVDVVEKLPLGPNGKVRLVESKVPQLRAAGG